jgi:hypothetical protein
MGYDISRFVGDVSDELLCSICSDVLEDPLTTECQHLFCCDCINGWLCENCTCPIDRKQIPKSTLKLAPKTIKNLLNELKIHCDYRSDGCVKVVSLEFLAKHVLNCNYRLEKKLKCKKGCGKMMTREELKSHNCLNNIRRDMARQGETIRHLTQRLKELDNPYDYQFRLISIGDSGVGKTSLLSVFRGCQFNVNIESTIGIDFVDKIISIRNDTVRVKLQVWDTGGQERFRY